MKWLLFQQFCNKVFKTILKNEREKNNFLLDDVFPEYWFFSNFFKTCVSSNWSRRYAFSTGKVDFWSFQILSFPRTDTDKTVHSRRENVTFYTSFSKKVRFLELKSMGWSILDEKTWLFTLFLQNFSTGKVDFWSFQILSFPRTDTDGTVHSRRENVTFYSSFSNKVRFLELKSMGWSILDEKTWLFTLFLQGFSTGKVHFWSFQILSFPRTDTDGTVHSRRGNVTFYISFSNNVRFFELKSMWRSILDEKT